MITRKNIESTNGRYSIDTNGFVHNNVTNRIMIPHETNGGYLGIGLITDMGRVKFKIHRLVAEAFLPKTSGLDCVNHINGDKTDNRLENLEWISVEGNIKHYRGLISSLKKEVETLKNEISELKNKKASLLDQ